MKDHLVRLIGRTVIAAIFAAVVTLFFGSAGWAQSPADKYPEKPIKIIVPFAPGGSVDPVAYIFGQNFTEACDHQDLI